MKTHRVVQLLTVCVVLLTGIALTLYYQLHQSRISTENLKAEILAEMLDIVDGSATDNVERQQQPKIDVASSDTGEHQTMAEARIVAKPAEAPLSKIEYWISNDYSDDKQHGFATWVELVESGHFIIQHCLAPDYSSEVTIEQTPDQTIKCKTLADSSIENISKSEIVLNNGKIVPIHLAGSTMAPTLSLTVAGQKVALVPGQKNTLAHGLSSLASVKEAHKVAFDKYKSLMSIQTIQ